MSMPPVPADPWAAWFPPGLDHETAADIGDLWWADDPHWAAYLAWTAYAATLPPTLSVSSVNTGTQSVSYSPAMPTGDYGAALARARWHRDQSSYGSLASVPLATARATAWPIADDWWEVDA